MFLGEPGTKVKLILQRPPSGPHGKSKTIVTEIERTLQPRGDHSLPSNSLPFLLDLAGSTYPHASDACPRNSPDASVEADSGATSAKLSSASSSLQPSPHLAPIAPPRPPPPSAGYQVLPATKLARTC
eukprot:3938958-Rhodomonas_salina.2